MNEHQEGNGRQRIPGSLFIAVLEQCGVFQELHGGACDNRRACVARVKGIAQLVYEFLLVLPLPHIFLWIDLQQDRKSTRLNSSHGYISYAVFCLKKKKKHKSTRRSLKTSKTSSSRI